jgi:hypothetical protein
MVRAPTSLLLASLILPAALAAQDSSSTTIGGYGEIHYTNASGPRTPGRATIRRFVIYLAHTFDERITMRSELEVEDAKIEAGSRAGEVALEQLYLDYRVSPALTLRGGLILTPVGILNETHEPTTFNGVARPDFDHDVIPTTWREIGVGALGAVPGVPGVNYRVYLVNGLQASGFSADAGIRGGRQEGQDATFANPSFTGRLEWAHPGVKVGGSFWYGGSAAQDSALSEGTFANPVSLLSADARVDAGPASFRAVVATVWVGGADRINAVYGNDVGSRSSGGYVEGAYDLLALLAPRSAGRLNAFARYEHFDTQAAVAAGTIPNDALARRYTTVGLAYKPIYNIALKADYQLRRNRAHTNQDEVMRLGVGYQF